ncbi:winged helix DNA-binding domain-containing protein [Pseudoxanthomonas putridarboris]|uniref:Winged helix DNA-binding domain-containing protein n=1 Tax=Pseudoxanthomonas putridarboris TaxID=752605 RepID=A0ABU9J3M5_9GAMM
MAASPLTLHRLHRHGIVGPVAETPAEAVRRMAAVQAQDYHASLWAVGLRTTGATAKDVEEAIARGEIVRTWPMRGTLHLLAREDVRWMLALMAPRVQAANAARIARDYGLDAKTLARCRRVLERALADGRPMARGALYARLDEAGIDSSGQRGLHVLNWLAHESLICQGPREGRQPTFVWFDAWVPPAPPLARDEALRRLALRYVQGHGPATAADLAWWSGLTQKDANAALALASPRLAQETRDGRTWWSASDAARPRASRAVHLLPAFDEYVIGYRHRDAVLEPQHTRRVIGANGLVSPTVVIDGRVVATWKRTADTRGEAVVAPLRALTDAERDGLRTSAMRLERFLGMPVRIA